MIRKIKLLYYLAAIGDSHLDVKLDILRHNLYCIYYDLQQPFDIIVNCYNEDSSSIEKMINEFSFIKNMFIHKKKGRLVELWKTNPYHNTIPSYDYILYILDDVRICKWNIKNLIEIKEKYSIEFLSPKVIGGTWDYMRNKPEDTLAFANNIELFCLLLDSKGFDKFMSINDIDNKHTWGVDYLLGHFNIKSAIYYKYEVHHMLPSGTDGGTAGHEMHVYLQKHGFNSVNEVNKKYPAIYNTIKI